MSYLNISQNIRDISGIPCKIRGYRDFVCFICDVESEKNHLLDRWPPETSKTHFDILTGTIER
jgi:hypothetical protein